MSNPDSNRKLKDCGEMTLNELGDALSHRIGRRVAAMASGGDTGPVARGRAAMKAGSDVRDIPQIGLIETLMNLMYLCEANALHFDCAVHDAYLRFKSND